MYAKYIVGWVVDQRKLEAPEPEGQGPGEKSAEEFPPELLPVVDLVDKQLAREIQDPDEGAGERGVEVVAIPRHPIHAVVDVRVGVVPCPPQQFDAHDVVGHVQHYGP